MQKRRRNSSRNPRVMARESYPLMSDRDITALHMDEPRPGDRFQEMYTFWVEVVYRDGDELLYWDSGIPDGEWPKLCTVDGFRGRFACRSPVRGYWISYYDGEGRIMIDEHGRYCVEAIKRRAAAEGAAASMMGACL